jgi:isomerase DpgB
MVLTEVEVAETAGEPVIRIDGGRSLSADTIRMIGAACDEAEDRGGPSVLRVVASGAPDSSWTRDLEVGLVSKWERALRRLERLEVTTVGVAVGDCGGTALDALLATDYRIATAGVRLLVAAAGGATWPGMAVYRLAQQAGVAGVRRAVLFGRPIEAREALDLHLVDELADDLAGALAATPWMSAVSSRDLAVRRRLMLDASTTTFEDALGTHLAACDRTLRAVADRVAAP